ncbi:MAG: hypothetical protein DRH30_02635 [Deltaproteobacteria bacterium]|nr:MAG: hypothetical protein DRH30_02635 [Deltaproteobacteria bacterium]
MNDYYKGDGIFGSKPPSNLRFMSPMMGLGVMDAGAGRLSFWEGASTGQKILYTAGLASVPALGYHGFKRNDSVGWALVWGVFGSMVWPITVPVALAQGFGKKPRVRKNRRRRSSRTAVSRRRRTSRPRRRRTSRAR